MSTVVPVSWVERTPTFKEKRRDQPDDINHALLTYPVLQTADIAIYHASRVPVGRDQDAHLELAREIVRAWNRRYGEYFPEPQAVYTDSPVILGTDGVNKMTKSVGNTIDIFAAEADLRKQVMSMVTDTQRDTAHAARPARGMQRLPAAPFRQPDDFETIWDGERTARTGCVDTKKLLAERMLEFFADGARAARRAGGAAGLRRAGPARRRGRSWRRSPPKRCARSTNGWVWADPLALDSPRMEIQIQDSERRWLRAVLIIGTFVLALVLLGQVASILVFFSDIMTILLLAWLFAFLLSPLVTLILRAAPRLPRVVVVGADLRGAGAAGRVDSPDRRRQHRQFGRQPDRIPDW